MKMRNRDHFLLETRRDPMLVLGTLRAHTATRRPGGGRDPEICFMGDIPYGASAFELRPVCHGRNAWLPIWTCTLSGDACGSVLEVRAGCHWFTRGFMTVWFGFLLAAAGMLTASLAEELPFGWLWLAAAPLALLPTLPFWAFGLLLSRFAFWVPQSRAKASLCRLLEGSATET